jgi:hypothetical protein
MHTAHKADVSDHFDLAQVDCPSSWVLEVAHVAPQVLRHDLETACTARNGLSAHYGETEGLSINLDQEKSRRTTGKAVGQRSSRFLAYRRLNAGCPTSSSATQCLP